MQYFTPSIGRELLHEQTRLPFLQAFPMEIRLVGMYSFIFGKQFFTIMICFSANRLIVTMDELRYRLQHSPSPAPLRNYPHCEELYPLPYYIRQPQFVQCKPYCPRYHCLSALCLTRYLKDSLFPIYGRAVNVPVAHADRHMPLVLKVRDFL